MIAGALAASRPEAAAIIQGAAETYVAGPPVLTEPISSIVTQALGVERAQELRAHGADMARDQAVAHTLTQTTEALSELRSQAQP